MQLLAPRRHPPGYPLFAMAGAAVMKLPLPLSWYPAQLQSALHNSSFNLLFATVFLLTCGLGALTRVTSSAQVTRLQNQSDGVFLWRALCCCPLPHCTLPLPPFARPRHTSVAAVPSPILVTFGAQALLLSAVDRTVLPAVTAIMQVRFCATVWCLVLKCVQRFRPGVSAVGCDDNSDKAHNEWLLLNRWSVRAPIAAVVALFYSLSNQVCVAFCRHGCDDVARCLIQLT